MQETFAIENMYKLNLTKWMLDIGVDEVTGNQPVSWFTQDQIEEHHQSPSVIFTDLSQIQKHFLSIRNQFANNNILLGDGILNPRIMIIGEAPSPDDDKNQRLFSGRAGLLLDQMLLAMRLKNRTQVYMTNVMPWRLPLGQKITTDDTNQFATIMMQHINLVQPQSILIFGGVSAKLLLNLSGGIMNIRGKIHDYKYQSLTVPAVVTFGLDYLLQNPSHKRQTWADLMLLRG